MWFIKAKAIAEDRSRMRFAHRGASNLDTFAAASLTLLNYSKVLTA
jgi:hypothetical protein